MSWYTRDSGAAVPMHKLVVVYPRVCCSWRSSCLPDGAADADAPARGIGWAGAARGTAGGGVEERGIAAAVVWPRLRASSSWWGRLDYRRWIN